jgi:hypothetical protein
MGPVEFPCHYCGGLFFFGELTKDHVVPKSKGGRDIVENIVPSCGPCNQKKGDEWPTCSCPVCLVAVEYFEEQWEGIPIVKKSRKLAEYY